MGPRREVEGEDWGTTPHETGLALTFLNKSGVGAGGGGWGAKRFHIGLAKLGSGQTRPDNSNANSGQSRP